jgi:hypothetical protein
MGAALFLLHRAVPTVPVHLGHDVGHHMVGHDPLDLGLGRLERLELGRAEVHMELAPCRHDVAPGATPRHAHVHRDAGPPAVQGLELDDLVGRFQERVAALLGLDTGVGGAPQDRDLVVGDPLARAHDVAVGPRAFEHEGHVVPRRQLPDHGAAERRADLLVGIADVRDRAEPVESGLLEHLDGEHPRQQPRLHVRDARAACEVTVDRERPLGDRPVVEHGVHVADQKDVGAATAHQGPDQEVPDPRLVGSGYVRRPSDRPPRRPESRLASVRDLVHARRRVRAAIDVDHPLQLGDELVVAPLGDREECACVHDATLAWPPQPRQEVGWHAKGQAPSSTTPAGRSRSSRS